MSGSSSRALGGLADGGACPSSPLLDTLHADEGEAEAIALSLQLKPDFVLLDESAARRRGELLGLNVRGVLGLLREAKTVGKIGEVKPFVDQLQGCGFRISEDLYTEFLKAVEEYRA